jgi:uncharacterized protein
LPVHVTVHDVAPPFRRQVELALKLCKGRGIAPGLLVVPNFHGSSPLEAHADFCAWLKERQRLGSEIFLHGFFHRAAGTGSGSRLKDLYFQRLVSANEAEFAELSCEIACERLDRGLACLRAAGLGVDGFVAPAWAMPRWLLPKLGERKLGFSEDRFRIYAPARARARVSPVLNYASRSWGRLMSTVAFCRLGRALPRELPIRIAVHPADLKNRLLRRELEGLLAWAEGHSVGRAAELFDA